MANVGTMGTLTRPSQAGQTDTEILRNEYDDSEDMDPSSDRVLVNEIDVPVENSQELVQNVAQATSQGNDTQNAQLDTSNQAFPLSTALAVEIIGEF